MSERPLRLLIDTNVWVDNYCIDHPTGASAKKLVLTAHQQGCDLLYAFHSIKDVQFVLEHEYKRMVANEGRALDEGMALAIKELSWACVRNMCELATAVGGNVADV